MNIILNFIPLKSGGGVQVGLDFISNIVTFGYKHNWYLVCTENTPFQFLEESNCFKIIKVIKNEKLSRLWFEVIGCRSLIVKYKIDVIYTQFGPLWYGSNVRNVVGCAYSNLMYPEIDFWKKLSFPKKTIKKTIDMYRKIQMLHADVIIYETEDLAKRAVMQNDLSEGKVFCVKSSPSTLVNKNKVHVETMVRCKSLPDGFLILLLAGYHPNKNIELLPRIAAVLKSRNINDIKFIITLPVDNSGALEILNLVNQLEINDYVINFEPVSPEGCCELYRSIDLVILPARLESFSNNIAESWIMEKPFMISDFDWARSICGDGALYFAYDDEVDAADKIVEIKNNIDLKEHLIHEGLNMLKTYPSSSERFLEYLTIIES